MFSGLQFSAMQSAPIASHPVAYLVDDDRYVLAAVSLLLNSAGIPFKAYRGAREFLEDYIPGSPGCLLLDVNMPGMTGPELQAHLKSIDADIPVIFLTGAGNVCTAVQAMKSGAVEFLQKPVFKEELLDAVARAFALDGRRRKSAYNEAALGARLDALSPRERETLKLLLEGRSAKEIGKLLEISPRTVEYHRNNILAKMEARCLVTLAAQVGRRLD